MRQITPNHPDPVLISQCRIILLINNLGHDPDVQLHISSPLMRGEIRTCIVLASYAGPLVLIFKPRQLAGEQLALAAPQRVVEGRCLRAGEGGGGGQIQGRRHRGVGRLQPQRVAARVEAERM